MSDKLTDSHTLAYEWYKNTQKELSNKRKEKNEEKKYDKYLELLDMDNKKIETVKLTNCCQNREMIDDFVNNFSVCKNCGITETRQEILFEPNYRNPKFKMSTTMTYMKKYYKLYRLHMWANHDYKENNANNNYTEIEAICKNMSIANIVYQQACNLYKKIYIDDEISSRDNIKRCMYIYCIYRASIKYGEQPLDIFEMLKKCKLKTDNYNKATNKCEVKLLINDNMKDTITKIKEIYSLDIIQHEFIERYNKLMDKLQEKCSRINKNTLLIITAFIMIEEKLNKRIRKKQFLEQFNISETTLLKFLKYIN